MPAVARFRGLVIIQDGDLELERERPEALSTLDAEDEGKSLCWRVCFVLEEEEVDLQIPWQLSGVTGKAEKRCQHSAVKKTGYRPHCT
jgi:hypothetical protein